jgi:hypothetical protein
MTVILAMHRQNHTCMFVVVWVDGASSSTTRLFEFQKISSSACKSKMGERNSHRWRGEERKTGRERDAE